MGIMVIHKNIVIVHIINFYSFIKIFVKPETGHCFWFYFIEKKGKNKKYLEKM